ncbi:MULTISPECIES: DUF1192 domain-containing protein [Limibacillus]|jgi:uncharacterized small protein (DUF1192 family)|uniref:Uncharacterized small protein (DUF1192 family) n=1 Tax=Limibacillus halophilus TaxID=1579333 RepID=A0A839SS51_9PROT|nr:DUF1192 domain-containing protein [Limibacillus halophilus]MBB3065302.1 uncharacterized small protein (DUF1192 family) [Limibacillus halophilus]
MDSDDLEPRAKKAILKDLEIMGVAELEDYIAGLRSEIERAQAVIDRKQSHRGTAESLFKS